VLLQLDQLSEAAGHGIAITLGITLLVSGLLPLLFTRGRHLAWVVLFAAGTLVLLWALR
jgi:hypothetical protein